MKILLAKSANITSTQVSILPPLGLLYLAGYLRKVRSSDELRFIDLRVTRETEYIDLLREWKPDVVALSAMTWDALHAHKMATMAKRLQPACKVVMGGPHATAYFQEVLAEPDVDFAVLHEGELTFSDLLHQLETGGDVAAVAGIAYRDRNQVVQVTAAREYVRDLDVLPLPDWDLIDFSKYDKCKPMGLMGGFRVAPLFTSRACPYQCTYCHDVFGKRFQKRSVSHVLDEIQLLIDKYQVRHFEIVDDIFNIDRTAPRKNMHYMGNL